jgi:potassium efflux system protein
VIVFVEGFALIYLVLAWLIGKNSVLLFLGRLFFEGALLAWLFIISKWCAAYAEQQTEAFVGRMRVPIAAVGYLAAGGALLLELTGYSSDAVYWLTSWGRTAAVFLWGVLIFLVLSEWYADAQKKREPEGEGDKISSFRWVVIWISWLAWAAATLIGIIVAWGGGRTVILEFFEALNTPFFVGNLRFQLTGFVYASLILLTTHGVSRIWRYLFKNKILASTGLESGLQESMTTIAVYILWIVGILKAGDKLELQGYAAAAEHRRRSGIRFGYRTGKNLIAGGSGKYPAGP